MKTMFRILMLSLLLTVTSSVAVSKEKAPKIEIATDVGDHVVLFAVDTTSDIATIHIVAEKEVVVIKGTPVAFVAVEVEKPHDEYRRSWFYSSSNYVYKNKPVKTSLIFLDQIKQCIYHAENSPHA